MRTLFALLVAFIAVQLHAAINPMIGVRVNETNYAYVIPTNFFKASGIYDTNFIWTSMILWATNEMASTNYVNTATNELAKAATNTFLLLADTNAYGAGLLGAATNHVQLRAGQSTNHSDALAANGTNHANALAANGTNHVTLATNQAAIAASNSFIAKINGSGTNTLLINPTNSNSINTNSTFYPAAYNAQPLKTYNNSNTVAVMVESNGVLKIGGVGSGQSVDPQVVILRSVDDTGTGNAHAFSDSSTINRSGGIGYNSFDGRVTYAGSSDYDHYALVQSAVTYGSSGTLTNYYGRYDHGTLSSGVIRNYYGLYFLAPTTNGSSVVSNWYGVYCTHTGTAMGSNYVLYSTGDNVGAYIAGPVEFGSTLKLRGNSAMWGSVSASNVLIAPSNAFTIPLRVLNSSGGTAFAVSSNGTVSIGTNVTSAVLEVNDGSFNVGLRLFGDNPSMVQIVDRAAGGIAASINEVYIRNVGSGTIVPAGTIGVYGSAGATYPTVDYLFFGCGSNIAYNANTFRIWTNNVAAFQGNLGVGTNGPRARLHVADLAANSDAAIDLSNDAQTWRLQTYGTSGDDFRLLDVTDASAVALGVVPGSQLVYVSGPSALLGSNYVSLNTSYSTNKAANGAVLNLNVAYQHTNAAGAVTFTGLSGLEGNTVQSTTLFITADAEQTITIPASWRTEDGDYDVVLNTTSNAVLHVWTWAGKFTNASLKVYR